MTPLRITDGSRFENSNGDWVEVVFNYGSMISYNMSGTARWAEGRLRCSRKKFLELLANCDMKKV